jgi:hypothetical protein
LDEQYYGWIYSGDDAFYGELDQTPLKLTLQSGSYFLVVEGTNGYKEVAIGIETPTGYSCRKETNQFPIKRKLDVEIEKKHNLTGTISYPNPASQQLSFNLDQDAKATVYFINSNGVTLKVIKLTAATGSSDVSDLPNGLYIVKIVQGENIKYEKVVIER